MPAIDPNAVLNDIRTLSSDEFGGRAPGSPGEQMTVDYLVKQFQAAGAQPGNPDGTWRLAAWHGPSAGRRGPAARGDRPRDRDVVWEPR